ncbi:MAG: DUF92 domain-containing protein [Candidatus Diapherotrites archaeon]|nr:DUF92 domain-containing protein [Candidatus Diapherotrites archaeon]
MGLGLEAALLPLIVMLLAYTSGALDGLSAVTGGVMGYAVIVSQDFDWFLVMLTFFVISMAATKYKYASKKKTGLSQERRSLKNVLGNGLVPLIFALQGNLPAFLGSLATATADTCSSEIGVMSKSDPVSILTWGRVKRGQNGGVSNLGNAMMFLGSGGIAVLGVLLFNSWPLFWISLWAGVFGCMVDSVLGATLENKGVIGNSVVNFLATLSGGALAAALAALIA